MKRNLAERVEKLEEKRKPRLISTWTDLMLWSSDMFPDEEVELSPGMQELCDEMDELIEAREHEARERDTDENSKS